MRETTACTDSPMRRPGDTVADLLKRLGNIPANRVRLVPTPGTATERDVLAVLDREKRPCELIEGTLVEKVMGYGEARVSGELLFQLLLYLRRGTTSGSPPPATPCSS